eukprot:5532199-Amphidinium_carterae.1
MALCMGTWVDPRGPCAKMLTSSTTTVMRKSTSKWAAAIDSTVRTSRAMASFIQEVAKEHPANSVPRACTSDPSCWRQWISLGAL